jgi:hypothetical protein
MYVYNNKIHFNDYRLLKSLKVHYYHPDKVVQNYMQLNRVLNIFISLFLILKVYVSLLHFIFLSKF